MAGSCSANAKVDAIQERLWLKMKRDAIIGVVGLVAGILVCWFLRPARVEEKLVERVVTVEKLVENKNVRSEIKETVRPDGTVTKETIITDTSTVGRDTSTKAEKEASRIVSNGSGLVLSGLVGSANITDRGSPYIFGLSASKPFIGPLGIGVFAFTNKTAGLSISLHF